MILATIAAVTVLAAADNNVEWLGISHVAWQDRRPLCPMNGETFEVRFQTWQNDLTSARVHFDDGSVAWVNAAVSTQRGPYDVWTAQLPSTAASSCAYWIELTDGTDTDFLSASGLSTVTPTDGGWALDFNTLEHAPIGCTPVTVGGAVFKVWAPGATTVHVRGEFNGWTTANLMTKVGDNYIRWVSNARIGDRYKYYFNSSIWKTDARGRSIDSGDNGNSVVTDPFAYTWTVEDFDTPPLASMFVYQAHVGTFSGRNDPLGSPPFPAGYTDMADRVGHLAALGVNCVMLCPITEFPFDESAGYNPITAWSPEWAYGWPDDFKLLVDTLHQNGIAVLLDIVWNHFSVTDNFLWTYDGTQIYFDTPAVATPWGDQADFDRPEVQDYFLDSALHWLEEYKVDGFRMDATDYMNQAQASGWSLMQRLNDLVDNRFADKVVIAEQLPDDSWVTRPTSLAGAGFDSQYHDAFTDNLRQEIFDAASGDPEMWKISALVNGSGQYLEDHSVTNYVELHDEAWPSSGGQRMVVTIDTTYPHDDDYARGRTKLAQGLTLTAPGVPAFLQGTEWLEDTGFGTSSNDRIDWSKKTTYSGIFAYYRDLVALRTGNTALWADAFHFTAHLNEGGNVIAFRRTNFAGEDLMVVANFSNTTYNGYRIGVPQAGDWAEILNSQSTAYGESGPDNVGALQSDAIATDGYGQSIQVEVPARALVIFRFTPDAVEVPSVAQGPDGAYDRIDRVQPNPARGRRSIAFTLAREGRAHLRIVDAAGREVATLLDGTRGTGAHRTGWNGLDANGHPVAAGVYFVRLDGPTGQPVSRKITVLR